MKFYALVCIGSMVLPAMGLCQNNNKLADTSFLEPVEVTAVRAGEKTPVAKTNLSKEELQKRNIGQDLPFILSQTPSVVVNADAGNGIGYTGIRIRGTDGSRINVTLNGIPYNDAESQGTYFVDVPDLASSAGSIQIQRGVGTSSNGAGAFGGSININTNDLKKEKSLEFNNTVGSYHSFKNTLILNSGIFAKHFTIDGRMSNIRSDGYIERASSNLRSFYGSAAYVNNKSSLRLNVLSGKEKTYQAWYGVDEATLATNRRYNSAGTEKPGTPYDNETDNYNQTHYQLFYNRQVNTNWKANVTLFFTHGEGYYEQYKAAAKLSSYGLPVYTGGGSTITKTDLVRRLWLDNNFYGTVFSFQYNNPNRQVITGGGLNKYDGKHFGEIKWALAQQAIPKNYRWYDNDATKTDYSFYSKYTEKLNAHWQTFLDLQVRFVGYDIYGFRYNPTLVVKNDYRFFNPKAGITYSNKDFQAYVSYARAAKEPNRNDYEANPNDQPRPEKLNDFELGVGNKNSKASWGMNLYYMKYKDQLVLTGKINDVGAYTRTNIADSYRAGIEMEGTLVISKWLSASANLTLSKNEVKHFTEYMDDYDNGGQISKKYENTAIAFSPAVISATSLHIAPFRKISFDLEGKYVGRQYMDNTEQESRSLDAFYTQNARVNYRWEKAGLNSVANFFLQVNNLFSKKYEPNGYTFSYMYGGKETTENYYFPMAPIYWTAGLNIKL
jgi:iron complex outermembrane recepter protein